MAENRPVGTSVCPSTLSPQHTAVPSGRTPQECRNPAVKVSKRPPGAFACPWTFLPQQETVPSVCSPQEW